MKFGPVPLEQAAGKILGHNVTGADGRRLFRKGKALEPGDIARLREMGRETVYVAESEPGDVEENEAAARIAAGLGDPRFRLSGPSTGRVNLYTLAHGLIRVDVLRLMEINRCDGVTLATLRHNSAAIPGKMAATLKILPYALPQATLQRAVDIIKADGPLLRMDPLQERKVSLILSGSPWAKERVVSSFQSALEQRLARLGSALSSVDFIALDQEHDEANLAQMITRRVAEGADLVVVAGETAIMDRYDIAPRAIERAGGHIIGYGAPVDPGNLLMLAELERVPILGAPGCARSPKDNIVDLLLPRLLVGDNLTREDITLLAHGGLLDDVPERPSPRSFLT